MARNPAWTEEELLLAYWVYKCRSPERLSASDPTVQRLSEVLISLPIHPQNERLPSFREPDGVRRRLSYLHAIDRGDEVPGHDVYREIVEAYQDQPEKLDRRARQVLASYDVWWE
jgi:5-methylcytosine-specific restriction protein A